MPRPELSPDDPSEELARISGEVSLEDFAFADTVMAADVPIEERFPYETYAPAPPPPASIRRRQTRGDLGVELRSAWARLEHGVRSSHEEMSVLWHATADSDARAPVARRLRTFFSFFEWQRDDVLRAAWIGFAVLVVVATLAAVVLTR